MLKSSSSRSEGQPSQQEAQQIGAQPLIMRNTLAGFAIIAAVKLGGSQYDLFLDAIRYAFEGMATSQGIDAVSNLVNSGSPHEIKDAVLQQLNDNSSVNDKNIYNNSRLCRILVMSCLLLAAGLSALRGLG